MYTISDAINFFLTILSIKTTICVAILTFLVTFIYRNSRRDERLAKFAETLPGPKPFPIVGNGLNIIFEGKGGMENLLKKYTQRYGPRFRMWFGKNLVVALTKAEDLEDVFLSTKTTGKPEIMRPLQDIWGNGLFTAPVPLWKKHRKLLEPTLGPKALKVFIPEMNELVYKFVEKLKDRVNGPEFDVHEELLYLSFDTLNKVLLNSKPKVPEKAIIEFHDIVQKLLKFIFLKVLTQWLHLDFISNHLFKTKMDENTKKVLQFVDSSLNAIDPVKDDSQPEKYPRPFLVALRQMEKEMGTNKIVYDHMINYFVGGTEDPAATNAFFILAVAMHPEIQERIYEELHDVFGDDDQPADYDDFDRLPYLNQVLKESMRRFTITPMAIKNVEEDVKIGSQIYPAGTALIISLAAVHHNPEYYPDPLKFNPEHFSPEALEKRHKFTFIPFGGGSRRCIGSTFAEFSMKLALIALLRTFTFHTTMTMDDLALSSGLLALSVKGYKISIKLRQRKNKQN